MGEFKLEIEASNTRRRKGLKFTLKLKNHINPFILRNKVKKAIKC